MQASAISLLDFIKVGGISPPTKTEKGYSIKSVAFFSFASPIYGIDLLQFYFAAPAPGMVTLTLRGQQDQKAFVQRTVYIDGTKYVGMPFGDWVREIEITTLAPELILLDIKGSSFAIGIQDFVHRTKLDTNVLVTDGAEAEFTADGLKLRCPDGTEATITSNHVYPESSLYFEQIFAPAPTSIVRDGIDSFFFQGAITIYKPGAFSSLGYTKIKSQGAGIILYKSGCRFLSELTNKQMVYANGDSNNPAESDGQLPSALN